MIVGVNLPNYSSLGTRDAMIAIAEAAEALGYASIWTNDHVLLPASIPEPFGNVLEYLTTLSYLAARANRIQLGTGILVLPQRDPLLVAKQAATVNHLSGGRLALAVGVGYIKQEYGHLRADLGNRGVLANEYISAMRELFESNAPEFHGQHIDYSDVLFSPRPSHGAPIFVGGNSRAALKRAAAFGDGWYGLWRSIQQYSEAGVDRLVIEPVSADLGVFLGQLEQFAQQVIPQLAPASALQSASEANSLMDPALLAGTMVI